MMEITTLKAHLRIMIFSAHPLNSIKTYLNGKEQGHGGGGRSVGGFVIARICNKLYSIQQKNAQIYA